jgi:uncharacterized protein YaaW (UPF0174 family)
MKNVEITLTPFEAEQLVAHMAGHETAYAVAVKVANQVVEQLSYKESTPLDWATSVRNLAYLRSIGGI